MEIIGREEELAEVARFLDAVPDGPSALLLEGPAGIGKTSLWRQGVEWARGRPHRVLACVSSGSETEIPFAGMVDLLDGLPDEAFSSLPPPQRNALDVALLKREVEGDPPDWRAAALGL